MARASQSPDIGSISSAIDQWRRNRVPLALQYADAEFAYTAAIANTDPASVMASVAARAQLEALAPQLQQLDAQIAQGIVDLAAATRSRQLTQLAQHASDIASTGAALDAILTSAGVAYQPFVAALNAYCALAWQLGINAGLIAGPAEVAADIENNFAVAANIPVPAVRGSLTARLAAIAAHAQSITG